ncbi:hypothetical protein Pelo_7078 [Pelomyxa schiedti]|nr:hypothetical protein Pelo_7078 [Pelomyxa schiedti]
MYGSPHTEAAIQHILAVSRVVWDHVIPRAAASPLLRHALRRGLGGARGEGAGPSHWHLVTREHRREWAWVLGVAEALFPLVPRACAAAAAAASSPPPRVQVYLDYGDRVALASSYMVLECAAQAGGAEREGGGGRPWRGRCLGWLMAHREGRGRNEGGGKEWLAVLRGLCVGGHIEAARILVDTAVTTCDSGGGGGGGRGSGGIDGHHMNGGCGCGGNMEAEVRDVMGRGGDDDSLLSCVCGEGQLRVAQWIVSRFGVTETWELWWPFVAALRGGHLEVCKWIADCLMDVRTAASVLGWSMLQSCAFEGGNLELLKWFTDSFQIDRCPLHSMVESFLQRNVSTDALDWISKHFPSFNWDIIIAHVTGEKPFRVLIQLGLVHPSLDHLTTAFSYICDVSLLETILDDFHVRLPGPNVLRQVFQNRKDSVPVVEFILQRAKNFPAKLLDSSLDEALCLGNVNVADWLEEKYHLIERLTQRSCGGIKLTSATYCGCDSLQWLFQHVSTETFGLADVRQAVWFHIPHDTDSEEMWKHVLLAIPNADIYSAQQLASIGQFSQSQMAYSITYPTSGVRSSKVVKWVIQNYDITGNQVREYENHLLAHLITKSKTNCCQWLIHRFNITLAEIIELMPKSRKLSMLCCHTKVSLWIMLLDTFPEITHTPGIVMDHFMSFVVASPIHIHVTRNRPVPPVGLTLDDVIQYCLSPSAGGLTDPTKLWLHRHSQSIASCGDFP